VALRAIDRPQLRTFDQKPSVLGCAIGRCVLGPKRRYAKQGESDEAQYRQMFRLSHTTDPCAASG
jgi:hypothetical protein